MNRVCKDVLGRTRFDNLSGLHDRDAMRDMADHSHVMTNEEQRQATGALKIEQKIEHLRLNRNIERRDRLVAEQDLRLDNQSAGDGHALALAAGKLVRELLQGGDRQANRLEGLGGTVGPARRMANSMDRQCLLHLVTNTAARIKRAQRIL